jgi:redox-sensing transcriptional repressor
MNASSISTIPAPVIRRLPRYLTHIRELRKDNHVWVSSYEIAKALGLTMSTVRQDFSHLDIRGISKRGYEIIRLERVLGETLGADSRHQTIIIGAGLMGRALAMHEDFEESGFETQAIFDVSPRKIGKSVGRLKILSMEELETVLSESQIDIGIIAVPASAAQEVADRLAAAEIPGILNLAHTHLQVPRNVILMEARILARMQEIAFAIRRQSSRMGPNKLPKK